MALYGQRALSCFPGEGFYSPVIMTCPNCKKTRSLWDGHTYRCPNCKMDTGRYVYDRLHFSFPELVWVGVNPQPMVPDAMTKVCCTPEESKRITEELRKHPPVVDTKPFRKITPIQQVSEYRILTEQELDEADELAATMDDTAFRYHAQWLMR